MNLYILEKLPKMGERPKVALCWIVFLEKKELKEYWGNMGVPVTEIALPNCCVIIMFDQTWLVCSPFANALTC